MIYRNDQIIIRKYWDLKDLPEIKSKEEAIEGIRFLLRDSIKHQLISDRPLGIFLSGGIDSSSVFGITTEFISGKVKTYSVGFDIKFTPEKYNRDFWLARETAKYYSSDHHELLISDIDAKDNLEKVIWHMEEPLPNPT